MRAPWGISLHLPLSDGVVNLTERETDIAICHGVTPDSTLIARRLATSYRTLSASPAYLGKTGSLEIHKTDNNMLAVTQVSAIYKK